MSAHTEGPWVAFSNSLGVGVTGPIADVAHCGGFQSGRGRQEEEANARLIAAAPAMLAALRLVAESGLFACYDDRAWDTVNDAIAAQVQP